MPFDLLKIGQSIREVFKIINDNFSNAIGIDQKGIPDGVATLDNNGQVPSNQLPSGQSGKVPVASDIKMTGYIKPSSASAIDGDDNVGIAIGKLEYKVDQGVQGIQGVTFTPYVDSNGNISWTNDGGLVNPATMNIKGGKGERGEGFAILGYYSTVNDLNVAVTNPNSGDAYAIGFSAPYDIYIWDGVGNRWVNNGALQGARGEQGRGIEFTLNGTQLGIRYEGETQYTFVELKGDTGADGRDGRDGVDGSNGIDGIDGADGKSVSLRISDSYLQWQRDGDSMWQNLIALDGMIDVTNIEVEISNISNDISDIANDIATINGDIANLGNDINNNKSDITDLGNEVADNTASIAALESDVLDVETIANNAMPKTGGTFTGNAVAAVTSPETIALHNMSAGTADMTAGSSTLATGTFYFVYEE